MRITAIQQLYNPYVYPVRIHDATVSSSEKVIQLSPSYNISFGTIPNSKPLRELFKYGLPCMYSGVEMIDSSIVDRMLKAGMFSLPAKYSIQSLGMFKKSLLDVERQVYNKMAARAKRHPEENLQELLIGLSKEHEKKLRSAQRPIFDELTVLSSALPIEYQEAFYDLMRRTDDKLNNRPVVTTFNKFNFQYKLGKIRDDVENIMNSKAAKTVQKMIRESAKMSDVDSPETREAQKQIIRNIVAIMETNSTLKNYQPLRQLLISSVARLNKEPVKIPFSRKSFISELSTLLERIPDKELREKMLAKAEELPTSKDAVDAYIVKYQDSPPDKIAYRMLHLTSASVEHLHPQSIGGPDAMSNFGGATVFENSGRGNIDFVKQLKRKPETAVNCQKYVDRLIELEKRGIFKKVGMDPHYIESYANKVYEESQGKVKLDISALYK